MSKTKHPRITWFTDSARKQIVDSAKRLLEEVGVFVENDEALKVLDGARCPVDKASRRVRMPAAVVEQAVATAPKRIRLYNRRGEVAMDLGGDRTHFTPGSAALRIYDARQRKARFPITADLVKFASLIDALPSYASQSTGLISSDVPQDMQDRYRAYIGLLHCSKPLVTGTFRKDAFRVMHAMLSAVAGGPEKLREKPNAIFDCCPSPPLKWSDLTTAALMDCARTGLVAELISMPLTGATSPVTLAGAVTQHCAECLSGIVIHQLVRPGSPIVYGGSPSCFDMRKGTTPMGAIETAMIDGAYAEIGKFLGLPVQAYMALSDAKSPDYQAGMETAMGAIIAVLSGLNNVSGPGMLDFESCQSLEKLVLDNETCGMALRLGQGIALRDDPVLSVELMQEGIQRTSFLPLAHTKKWFRKEVYFPDEVIDRGTLEEWERTGSKDALHRASERVEQILATRKPEPLGDDLRAQLKELMTAEARQFGLNELPAL